MPVNGSPNHAQNPVPLLEQWTLSRRDLLKVAGGGAAVSVLYSLGIRGFHLGQPESVSAVGSNDFEVEVLRPKDLLKLRFRFINLKLDISGALPVLKPNHGPDGVFIIAYHQMQSILEQAWFQTAADLSLPPGDPDAATGDENPSVAAGTRPAGESRLVFRVPPEVSEIPYDLQSLLDWSRYNLEVSPHALPGAEICDDRPSRPAPIGLFNVQATNEQIGATVRQCLPRPPEISTTYGSEGIFDASLHTAIEATWQLMLSPSYNAAWAHQQKEVEHFNRVELWHTRLGVRRETTLPDGTRRYEVDEEDAKLRTARAIWSQDYEPPPLSFGDKPSEGDQTPFRAPLNPRDRHDIVRMTSDFHIMNYSLEPLPVQVNRLMLSALGAWIDTRGAWNPPSVPEVNAVDAISLEEWRHRATMGRDHFVRIVRKGYLFPFGHRASLVKITERKFETYSKTPQAAGNNGNGRTSGTSPVTPRKVAFLRQRMFIIVRQPEKSYKSSDAPNQPFEGRKFPFQKITITTQKTPDLNDPANSEVFTFGDATATFRGQAAFWPRVGSSDFLFTCIGEDADGQTTEFTAPLAFVTTGSGVSDNGILMGLLAAQYNETVQTVVSKINDDRRTFKMYCQRVALGPSTPGKRGDTSLEVGDMTFGATLPDPSQAKLPLDQPRFYPIMRRAHVRLREAEIVSGDTTGGPLVEYPNTYLEHGFDKDNNKGQVYLKLPAPAGLTFGADKGGVATPNIKIVGISRLIGPVGGAGGGVSGDGSAAAADDPLADFTSGKFDPQKFLSQATDGAKLLGGIKLADIISLINDFQLGDGTDKVPTITARAIFPGPTITNGGFEDETTVAPWEALNSHSLASSTAQKKFGFQSGKVTSAGATGGTEFCRHPLQIQADDVTELTVRAWVYIPTAWNGGRLRMKLSSEFNSAGGNTEATADMDAKDSWQQLVFVFKPSSTVNGHIIFDTEGNAPSSKFFYLDGLGVSRTLQAPSGAEVTLFWQPQVKSSPLNIFEKTSSTELRIAGRFVQQFAGGDPVFAINGRLTDFKLNLLGHVTATHPSDAIHFITIEFSKLAFSAKTGQKADLDIDISKVSFHGVLKIVDELQRYLKSKGFSIDISIKGIKVSYTLSIPDTTIGAYALTGMALTAGLNIPFDGSPVRVRFAFASRDNPFLVTVSFVSGGGFFAISLGLDGVEMLELSIEFGARVALNLGVASGSVELMGGLYFKLEFDSATGDEKIQLTAFLRLRGKLSVLGIIKVTVEFYIALEYRNPPDDLYGIARVTVKIEILFFSKTVKLEVKRRLPASTHQITFEDLMSQSAWKEYVGAFAPLPP